MIAGFLDGDDNIKLGDFDFDLASKMPDKGEVYLEHHLILLLNNLKV